ncbi:hypothetical protein NMY22_g2497 [Coprinellus aureogranulatus]|nr:hypothetical protein NMY22_g2497 [Coprinellus aureogranulatus]
MGRKSSSVVSPADGLTKDQRYYRKNLEKIRKTNRERNKRNRELKKAQNSKGKKASQVQVEAGLASQAKSAVHTSAVADLDQTGINPSAASVEEQAITVPIPLLPGPDFLNPGFWDLEELDDAAYRPPSYDGFTIARLHRITQVSEGLTTPHDPAAIDVSEWERFRELHVAVVRWSSVWGGVTAWSESFESIFRAVCVRGSIPTRNWMSKIWGHAEVGKRLLDLLRVTNLPLPNDPDSIVVLWTKKAEDIVTLATGIAIIDTRFDILGRGLFGVSGEPDSDSEKSQSDTGGHDNEGEEHERTEDELEDSERDSHSDDGYYD